MNYSPIKRGEGVERRGIFLTPSAYRLRENYPCETKLQTYTWK
jgi:hypothetical protein